MATLAAMATPQETLASKAEAIVTLEPSNAALKAKYDWAQKTRAAGKSTIPSTIGEEKLINPCLRTDSAELRANLKQIDPSIADDRVAIFAKTRELKDRF